MNNSKHQGTQNNNPENHPGAEKISRVVILGGGTAGWISAALLVRLLGKVVDIVLVESEQIGTVGVGEATIPPILNLNRALGLDEAEFMRRTRATIKLGIQFEDWSRPGASYMHAFGDIGKDFPFCSFHHFWTRYRQHNPASDFWDFSLAYQAAAAGKFKHLERMPGSGLKGLVYAYHFDATLYAQFLREYAESRGVQRIEGKVQSVQQHPDNGHIRSLTLESGEQVDGDLFIDCSGFRALLMEQTLGAGFEDWSHWLPCDRAIAVQSKSVSDTPPLYTRATAREAGWQWRIPVQGRNGNGLVYSSRFCTDAEAERQLRGAVDGELLGEPRVIRFKTGRRRQQWHRNCVAVGLASGFIEPLESTSIHMVQSAVLRLIKLFPHRGINPAEVAEFNRQSAEEWQQLRDFIILHYCQNQRDDPFWQHCRRMALPDSLAEKIALFRESGKTSVGYGDLFQDIAWQQVMLGQELLPEDFHPLANTIDDKQLEGFMGEVRGHIADVVKGLPDYQRFLDSLN